jgi:hypothetical protein
MQNTKNSESRSRNSGPIHNEFSRKKAQMTQRKQETEKFSLKKSFTKKFPAHSVPFCVICTALLTNHATPRGFLIQHKLKKANRRAIGI